jgi:hypothetical protein
MLTLSILIATLIHPDLTEPGINVYLIAGFTDLTNIFWGWAFCRLGTKRKELLND